ncbi:toll-like receptor 5 [Brienomyrus brachyistius]|uniref:toll-like receptor 5 n=1 Tax=Brienomyrus brachyistius TaxID=42636 RepID=UPI0020B2F684|nr:toll-like receptor 5 [Brienomyrus brachyistius]
MWSHWVLALVICLMEKECVWGCLINGRWAFCVGESLYHIPLLPATVTAVDLSVNYISELNETSLLGLEGLERLHIGSQKTNILKVRAGTFRRLSSLKFLDLGDNKLLVLEPHAFMGLSQLQYLDLMHNGLNESILEDEYLQPLLSLESLNLFGNEIHKIQPGLFFQNMRKLKIVDLSLNRVGSICEQDLRGFQDKHFQLLKLSSLQLNDVSLPNFDWRRCGNPLRSMSFTELDFSSNGMAVENARLFFSAIAGTKIDNLILSSNTMGRSFGYQNFNDPNNETFSGLNESSVKSLDLSRNSIFSLEFSVFHAFGEAERITFANNKINQIQRDAFLGLENLQHLNLSYNLMGEIYDYTFDNLPGLIQLDLSYNHIGAFAYKSFKGLVSLRILNLTGNMVDTLFILAPISSLQFISLADNKLTSLYGLSDFSKNSLVIDLEQNRLRRLSDLYSILNTIPYVQIVLLGSNMLSSCNPEQPMQTENNLLFLDLQNNALQTIWEQGTCIDVFHTFDKLLYLYLNHNLLRSLPSRVFEGLTSLRVMNLSFNLLTYLPQNAFPKNLKSLDLSHNILSSPDPRSFQSVIFLDLGMNRFICDCNLVDFLMWINHTNVTFLSPKEKLICEYPKELLGYSIVDLNADSCEDDEEERMSEIRFCLFVGFCTVLISSIMSTIIYTHCRGELFAVFKKVTTRVLEGRQKTPAQDGSKYDVYLCFSNNDFKWVETALLKTLDSQFSDRNPFRCCFEARDFIPGEDYISSIRDAIWYSKKTVCVVSKEFLKDGWCIEAFKLAESRMLQELRDVLIMIIVGSIPPFKLMKHETIRTFIQKKVYLEWPEDIQDIEWFYDKLIARILKEEKVKRTNTAEFQNISFIRV